MHGASVAVLGAENCSPGWQTVSLASRFALQLSSNVDTASKPLAAALISGVHPLCVYTIGTPRSVGCASGSARLPPRLSMRGHARSFGAPVRAPLPTGKPRTLMADLVVGVRVSAAVQAQTDQLVVAFDSTKNERRAAILLSNDRGSSGPAMHRITPLDCPIWTPQGRAAGRVSRCERLTVFRRSICAPMSSSCFTLLTSPWKAASDSSFPSSWALEAAAAMPLACKSEVRRKKVQLTLATPASGLVPGRPGSPRVWGGLTATRGGGWHTHQWPRARAATGACEWRTRRTSSARNGPWPIASEGAGIARRLTARSSRSYGRLVLRLHPQALRFGRARVDGPQALRGRWLCCPRRRAHGCVQGLQGPPWPRPRARPRPRPRARPCELGGCARRALERRFPAW